MQSTCFSTLLAVPSIIRTRSSQRVPICAKAKKGKRTKKARKSTPPAKPGTQSSAAPSAGPPTPAASDPPADVAFTQVELPAPDESLLRLPELNTDTVRRKRKPRVAPTPVDDVPDDAPLSTDSIRRLTKAYRQGGDAAQELITEIEKNPDYMIQTGNPKGEYDLTSAIIGSGRPNQQGLYILPYLQSGHLLLLTIILVAANVYYPGFPLTEADEGVREGLKRGLALVAVANSVLAVFAYRSAKRRDQPAFFWALKTAFLGDLAFGELRRNAPMVKKNNRKDS